MSTETDARQQTNGSHDEVSDWMDSLRYVLDHEGEDRATFLLTLLNGEAYRRGVDLPFAGTTPPVNTIPADEEPPFPGDRDMERRIKSLIRWNAMAMVVQANRTSHGIGGHISTYGSAATLYEVGFNHFWRARTESHPGDSVYVQGHAAPGIYARAFLEGRLSAEKLHNFRQELAEGGGLASYPHPWLMPDFWEFPTVSMGLGPIMAIYQARFHHYLVDRELIDRSDARVWAMLGDGETDEPESLGAIHLAGRENLNNLIFVVNCNLQRLDGPVRGNGSIVRELEGVFRGAGWNVLKVLWGEDWDPLLHSKAGDRLIQRLGELRDGDLQKYVVEGGEYIREHFFGKYPELAELVQDMSDEKLARLRRGGHDPQKVYAAYKAAVETPDRPTAILALTIKGYGQGEAGEGRNISHKQKELNEQELEYFRSRFSIPIPPDQIAEAPFFKPDDESPEIRYLKKRRVELGGYLPARRDAAQPLDPPSLDDYRDLLEGSGDKEISTTMAFVRLLTRLLRDKKVGERLVPIVPDEARTFGMESMFRQVGIYSHHGQSYDPVDRDKMLYYREIKKGQMLEEGITEAGCMSSFIAAGTSRMTYGLHMIPIFMFYSMFGFQRVGDLIWAACDARARGFLIGGTSGRTTLAGEGLQHQDGHSLLLSAAYPTIRSYDVATAYDAVVLTLDGMKRMFHDDEECIYYLTIQNENHIMPAMPPGAEAGIRKGIYKFSTQEAGQGAPVVQLLGSGSILFDVVKAQNLLAEQYGVSSTVWNVTSYIELRRDAMDCERWSRLHPDDKPRQPYLDTVFQDAEGPFVAASDFVRNVPEQICRYVPGGMTVLGTDGFGRSDSRTALRDFFEISPQHIAYAALYRLADRGQFDREKLVEARKTLGINPDAPAPWTV